MGPNPDKWKILYRKEVLVGLMLLAAAYVLFANTFWNAWTYDDFPVVINNPDIQSIAQFLANSYPGRPLRELSFLVDFSLFGLDPAGWHLQNIFWHGLNAWFVFQLVCRLGGSLAVAWIASLLFLTHPAQVEVVANISHRKDSLAAAFTLLSLLSFWEFHKKGHCYPWLAASALFLGIGFLAKENAIAALPMFLVLEALFVKKDQRFFLRHPRLVTWAGLAGVAGAGLWFYAAGGVESFNDRMAPWLLKMNVVPAAAEQYLLMIIKGWAFLAGKFFFPLELAPEYVFSVPVSWVDPWIVAAFAGVGASFLAAYFFRHRCKLASFCFLWVPFFWLPVSGLWPASYPAADRYLYLPAVGLCILIGLFLHHLLKKKVFLFGTASLLLLCCVFLTFRQNQIWRSEMALWEKSVRVNPDSAFAWNGMGASLTREGKVREAIPCFERAMVLNPRYSLPVYNLGVNHQKLGNEGKAKFYLLTFLRVAANSSDPYEKTFVAQAQNYLLKKHRAKD